MPCSHQHSLPQEVYKIKPSQNNITLDLSKGTCKVTDPGTKHSMLGFESSGQGLSSGQGNCAVFLDKTLNSRSAVSLPKCMNWFC